MMKNQTKKTPKKYLTALLLIFAILATSCSGTADDGYNGENPNINDFPGIIHVVENQQTRKFTAEELKDTAISELLQPVYELSVFARNGILERDLSFQNASLQITGSRIDYVFADGSTLEDIVGLMADAPERSITDAFHGAVDAMKNGERVIMLLIDGWGWELFNYHKDVQPFLRGLEPEPAVAAYIPITNVGLATVITGVRPNIHGIHGRNYRRINEGVQDIFAVANGLGLDVVYIQSNSNIIETSMMPIFSFDHDGELGTDNEVFENAKANLSADFLFVHFHGIDDEAHTYGPYSEEVAERLEIVDDFVRQLVEGFGEGTVVIVSDHGLHPVAGHPDRLGNHDHVSHEDIISSLIITRRESR